MSEHECFSLFALEWCDEVAALIFSDDNWSEFRASDPGHRVEAPEALRKKIAHGDLRPMASEECMQSARAFQAAREYLVELRRPSWLEYRYVK